MIEKLQTYYCENGILSTAFTCAYRKECQGSYAEFTGPKAAFVSSGYETNTLPRLLFLSLDSGDGDTNANHRLPQYVRQQEEIDRDVIALPKHKHWYRTHELAWYIFKSFDSSIKIHEAKRYFAHANAAKCCMNKAHSKKADSVLFRNCRRYLRGELEILLPKIIVTQGNEAKDGILSLRCKVIERIDNFAGVIEIDGRQVFWLHTYHPSNWGAFNKQRNFNKTSKVALGWEKYSAWIHKFIEHHA